MLRFLASIVWLALALGCAGCATAPHLQLRQKLAPELSATAHSAHVDLHWRPGSRAATQAARIAAAAEQEIARLCALLEVENDTRFSLFLFDDVSDLWKTTGTSGNAGFSVEQTCCLVYDDDTARLHELVHVIADAKFRPFRPTGMFLVEGLANALLVSLPGVDVHAVAKFYRDSGQLPRLAEMADAPDFYAWIEKRPGFNAYDVAGSWMRFLIDSQGIEKTKRYYRGELPPAVFGRPLAELEQDWLAALDRHPLAPEMLMQVALTAGGSTRRHTRLAGESFQISLDYTLMQPPTRTPEKHLVLVHKSGFTYDELKVSDSPHAAFVKYIWLKNGVPVREGPTLKLSNLTEADSGVYLGVVGIKDSDAEPEPVVATAVVLTVAPQPD